MIVAWIVSAGVLAAAATDSAVSTENRAAYESALARVGRSPDLHVELALWCEAHGLKAERLKHLALAVLIDPKNATARGLMGLVAYHGRWQRPEQVGETIKADEALTARLAEYNARRARMAGTADAHWKMVLWCEQNGLSAEAQAHLTAVTRLDPGREAAWKRLGCRKVGGRWVTEAQLAAEKENAEAQKAASLHWKPLLTQWRVWLNEDSHRAEAVEKLAEVSDPLAVPAVWEVFGREEAPHQLRAVQLLGQIDAAAASRALALLVAWGSSDEVRQAATLVLRRREPLEYVGFYLALLRKPIVYQTGVTLGEDGFYHRVLHVEGKKYDSEVTFGAKIGRPGAPLGYPSLPYAAIARSVSVDLFGPQSGQFFSGTSPYALMGTNPYVLEGMLFESAINQRVAQYTSQRPPAESWRFEATVQQIESTNAAILRSNSAIYASLNQVTQQDLPEDREVWRKWYTNVQGYSYTRPQEVEQPRATAYVSMPSCFAAGTPVVTIDGSRPIEALRVGDQVLAQNTRTGALNFRAVTTVHHNPPAETLGVRIGGELIVPSVFHRFWKAGRGWAIARDLKAGDVVRTYGGPERIESVTAEGTQRVFNLDIAEDHSFFVGRAAALVHDNTLPDTRLVPFDAARDLASVAAAH
jgi:hypothetical protein